LFSVTPPRASTLKTNRLALSYACLVVRSAALPTTVPGSTPAPIAVAKRV
jgi:hypothetical protein